MKNAKKPMKKPVKRVQRFNDGTGPEDFEGMEAGMMEKEPEENFRPSSRAKSPIVTKKQLEDSGLSLRDYMNKQQGLTRRGGNTESKSVMEDVVSGTPRTRAESLAAIPTGGKAGAGPTAGNGNSVDSTELGRNFSALMNAAGPGRLATGLTLAAREAKAGKGIQDAYNARAAARRSEEGLSAAEAAAVKATGAAKATRAAREAMLAPRAAREAKTLNPNAYLAGPKGMRDDFKKGGKVNSAPKRGDGIAQRGKTRGRMC